MPRPSFITCPLCGKGFGSASIDIHMPQCYDKAIKRWRLDPVGPKPVMPAPPRGRPMDTSGRLSVKGTTARGSGASAARVMRASQPPSQAQVSYDDSLAEMAPEGDDANLHACSKCGRKFRYDRITYHESVCKGNIRRNPFDSSAHRTFMSGGETYTASASSRGGGRGRRTGGAMGGYKVKEHDASSAPRAPQSNWRAEHEAFISAIRQARSSDAAAKAMWGGTSSIAPAMPHPPSTSRVPPSMVRQDQMRKANIASGGRAARAPPAAIVTPGTRAVRRPVAHGPPSRAFGTSTNTTGAFRNTMVPGAGGGGRIVNDNTTSAGMLQAFGRA